MSSKQTKTSPFGVSGRASHDASDFYHRKLFSEGSTDKVKVTPDPEQVIYSDWMDTILNQSAEQLPLPGSSIALAFTSPPYNVGKAYDQDLTLIEYLDLIRNVGAEVYRVLKPGGRYVINVANIGRSPYIPLTAFFHLVHAEIGFLPMGEIIWQKGKGANGSCAWGSWRNASAPRLRDLHEYLLVFAKDAYKRPDKGVSDISTQDFMRDSLSTWEIPAESAKKIGHPAPFPVALAERVIRFYSYLDDVVLDPFVGSGTTCVAAKKSHRHYVGVDISPEYCDLARKRLAAIPNQGASDL